MMQNEPNNTQDKKPRAKSTLATASWWATIAPFIASDVMTQNQVKNFFKETPSDWARHKGSDNILKMLTRSLAAIADPKQWKSTAVSLGILIGGVFTANTIRRTLEEKEFEKKFSDAHTSQPEALANTSERTLITDAKHQGHMQEDMQKEQKI